jgi:hypothetical protein
MRIKIYIDSLISKEAPMDKKELDERTNKRRQKIKMDKNLLRFFKSAIRNPKFEIRNPQFEIYS